MSMIGIRGVECGLCGGSSVVEHLPSKQRAAGSNPVSRSSPATPRGETADHADERGPPHITRNQTAKDAKYTKRGVCGEVVAEVGGSRPRTLWTGGGVVGEVRGNRFLGEAVAGVVDDGIAGVRGNKFEVQVFVGGVVVH